MQESIFSENACHISEKDSELPVCFGVHPFNGVVQC